MSKKRTPPHSTDGLKGLRLYFDGSFRNPFLSKIQPYIFAFGAKIYIRLDERVDCVVQGENTLLTKKELSKFPGLKTISYQEFLDEFFSSNKYLF